MGDLVYCVERLWWSSGVGVGVAIGSGGGGGGGGGGGVTGGGGVLVAVVLSGSLVWVVGEEGAAVGLFDEGRC